MVHAVRADVKQITAEDVSADMDLSVCTEEGSYDIPVEITLPEGYELASNVSLTVISTKQAVQTEGE